MSKEEKFIKFSNKCDHYDISKMRCMHPKNKSAMAKGCNCPDFDHRVPLTDEEFFDEFRKKCPDKCKNDGTRGHSYKYSCCHPEGRYAQCWKIEWCPKWKEVKQDPIQVTEERTGKTEWREVTSFGVDAKATKEFNEKHGEAAHRSISGETDRDGIGQHEAGAKLDGGKIQAGILGDFGLALLSVAKIGTGGVHKYTRGGWQEVNEGLERYEDALWRHLLKKRYSEIDPDFGLPHMAHLVWNALAVLELEIRKEIQGPDYVKGDWIDPQKLEDWMSKLTPEINELERKKKEKS